MAQYGEGGKRRIAEFALETDCFEWSKTLLSNLLTNQTILNGEGGLFIKTKNIKEIEGIAFVHIADKGKLIPQYKLHLVVNWTGEAKGESGDKLADVSGVVDVAINSKKGYEDTYLRVVVKDEGVFGKRFEDAFLVTGEAFVLKKIKVYVDAMAKGGPANDELDVMELSTKAAAGAGTLELQLGLYSKALVFLFGVVFAILGVFAHLHFGFGGANTTLNFSLFIYWLMYVDRRRQFVRSMCVLAAAFCFGAIASRYVN